MATLSQPQELVEKMIVETRPRPWVGLSIGGCGVLACATLGKHDGDFMGSRSIALEFAYHVVHAIKLSPNQEQVPIPPVLDDTAALMDSSTYFDLLCTTWRLLPQGIEICSVGSTSVLVFEEDSIQEVIKRHTVNEILRDEKSSEPNQIVGEIPTHVLGGNNPCSVEDVRVAHIPLLPTTIIAVIVNRRLAEALLEQAVSRNDLPAFIEGWTPRGKRNRTSVLISL